MSIIALLVTLVVIGVILYLVNQYLPMDPKIKTILNVVIVIAVIFWLVAMFVPQAGFGNVRVH